MVNRHHVTLLSMLLCLVVMTGCSVSPPGQVAGEAAATQSRPGLATRWGETQLSQVKEVQFTRAHPSAPTMTAKLYYSDQEGLSAAFSQTPNYERVPAGLFPVGENFVSFGIRDENGDILDSFLIDGEQYVRGERGHHYVIVVRNHTGYRLEAVLSVDGLDVLDGKSASVTKPGYVLAPYATLEVEGFRQSFDAVAAFRFGSVSESYAHRKYGDTQNVGVIGLAIFHEYGDRPSFWTKDELQQRRSANPFPRDFATPP